MTSKQLKEICLARFGNESGYYLYAAMRELQKKGFCVASAWQKNEISIARECGTTGVVFIANDSYQRIQAPGGIWYDIKGLKYNDLTKYLPRRTVKLYEKRNCALDDRVLKEESA